MDLTQRPVGVNGDGMLVYRFSFVPNGSAAPTLIGGKYVASIVRKATLGAGATPLFLVTFASNFGALLGFRYGVREASGGPLAGMCVQVDPANTNTTAAGGAVIALRLFTATSPFTSADFTTSTAGASVDVELTFGNDPNNQT